LCQLDQIPQLQQLSEQQRFEMRVVATVLPFRVNHYVINELINWGDVPSDPMFQLCFPQKNMLSPEHFNCIAKLLHDDASQDQVNIAVDDIRQPLNPHPANQLEKNIPQFDGERLEGIQHKCRETVLFFPVQGQTCHSFCSFCFRWAQFVGDKELKIAANDAQTLHSYLREHIDVTDVLITGGDPLIMKAKNLRKYIEPLLQMDFAHITTIRMGTKALSFWPQRFVTDDDAEDLLLLLRQAIDAGKHVALMAHYNHWRELDTDIAELAISCVREVGVEIRSQGPLLAHINNSADVWARMWQRQVELGIMPYDMFVERDTGAKRYFEVPLERAWEIYHDAIQQIRFGVYRARPLYERGPR